MQSKPPSTRDGGNDARVEQPLEEPVSEDGEPCEEVAPEVLPSAPPWDEEFDPVPDLVGGADDEEDQPEVGVKRIACDVLHGEEERPCK